MAGLRGTRSSARTNSEQSQKMVLEKQSFTATQNWSITPLITRKKKMDEESWNSVALSAPLGKGHSTHYWRWYSNGMIHFNLALLEFVRLLNNYSLSCKVLKMSSAVCVLYYVSITVANVIIQVISPRSVTSAGSYSESLENHRDQNPFPHLILTVI